MKSIFRNYFCVAFRTKEPQKCVEILNTIGYKFSFHPTSDGLPNDYKDESLVITFYGGTYTLAQSYPSLITTHQIFVGRVIPNDIDEFNDLVSVGNLIELTD